MPPRWRSRSVAGRRAGRRAGEMPRRQRGGGRNSGMGWGTPTVYFPLVLFGLFVLDRTTRTAPAERARTGATPAPEGSLQAPRPARWPDDQPYRAARCLTDSSARFSSSAASVPRAPGRGRACSPMAIPWPCSSAITRRTFTRRSSCGTTSVSAPPRPVHCCRLTLQTTSRAAGAAGSSRAARGQHERVSAR